MLTETDTLPDGLPVVNCAECGAVAARAGDIAQHFSVYGHGVHPPAGLAVVGGRISGRPYCRACISTRKPPPGHYGPHDPDDDADSPWYENARRHAEDAPE